MLTKLIILAAGQGTRLLPLTKTLPKCMVELAGIPLIERQIATARELGIEDIIIIGGYLSHKLEGLGVKLLHNKRFSATNMVSTLMCAREEFGDDFILSYGDIVYHPLVLSALLREKSDCSVVVDLEWKSYWCKRFSDPLSDAESLKIKDDGSLVSIGQEVTYLNDVEAQYIGLMRFRNSGIEQMLKTYSMAEQDYLEKGHYFRGKRNLDNMYMTDLLQGMIDNSILLKAVPIRRKWFEIDSISDLRIAEELFNQNLGPYEKSK